jgi:uncharacterized membrane protein
MKQFIKLALLTVAALFGIFAVLALGEALPHIMDWLAGNIGEFFAWVVFIFVVGSVIAVCISERKF